MYTVNVHISHHQQWLRIEIIYCVGAPQSDASVLYAVMIIVPMKIVFTGTHEYFTRNIAQQK